jgi:hypothetical protein
MASDQDLAVARAQAAEQLEAAIRVLGTAYAAYTRATAALEARTQQDLGRYLENPIVLRLVQAGLSAFLERRLVGTPAALRALVEAQHRTLATRGARP